MQLRTIISIILSLVLVFHLSLSAHTKQISASGIIDPKAIFSDLHYQNIFVEARLPFADQLLKRERLREKERNKYFYWSFKVREYTRQFKEALCNASNDKTSLTLGCVKFEEIIFLVNLEFMPFFCKEEYVIRCSEVFDEIASRLCSSLSQQEVVDIAYIINMSEKLTTNDFLKQLNRSYNKDTKECFNQFRKDFINKMRRELINYSLVNFPGNNPAKKQKL